jgi:hypothetical protein
MYKHEMRLLANRFFQLSLLKQLVILFMLYIMFVIVSIMVQIVSFMLILAGF